MGMGTNNRATGISIRNQIPVANVPGTSRQRISARGVDALMAMQFEHGTLTLRIDDVGLFLHNSKDNGSIQLDPDEGNVFIHLWAMSQAALAAHSQMHGHILGIAPHFIPPPDDDEDPDLP